MRKSSSRFAFFFCLLVLAGSLVSGCSSRGQGVDPRASFRSPNDRRPLSIEIESSEQEALKAIKNQPLEFELPFPEATYAWERARTFFLQYTGSFAVEPLTQGGKPDSLAMVVSNKVAASDAYIFEVRRVTGKKGAKFSISARARSASASSKEARTQAQNLARFIKSGTLDAGITPPASKR